MVPPAVNGAGAASFNVAITFDRNRITSCSCTCDKADVATWCSHIVAVCLQRLHQVHIVDSIAIVKLLNKIIEPSELRRISEQGKYVIGSVQRDSSSSFRITVSFGQDSTVEICSIFSP